MPSEHSKSCLISPVVYIAHTFTACVVVTFLALLLSSAFTSITHASQVFENFLSVAPPVYLVVGFVSGFFVNGKFKHRPALLVWILPLLAFLDEFHGEFVSLGFRTTAASLLFNVPPVEPLEAFMTACPLYSAIAYSLGAWAGLKWGRRARESDRD